MQSCVVMGSCSKGASVALVGVRSGVFDGLIARRSSFGQVLRSCCFRGIAKAHLNSLGQHFSLVQTSGWVDACCSRMARLELVYSMSCQNKCKGETKREQTYQLLLAEDADRSGLLGLDRGAVGVDRDTSASSLGLFVLAVDTVLLGDRHLDCVTCLVWQKTRLAETPATKDC